MTATTVFGELRDALAELEFEGAAIGIDLGTTKSCIAVARFEKGEIVCACETVDEPGQPEGQIAVPSVVAVKDGMAIVGHAAKRLARTPRFHQHRGSFSETKNEIGLRHTYARAPEGIPVRHRHRRPHHPSLDGNIRAQRLSVGGAARHCCAGVFSRSEAALPYP